jgi:NADH pyrophosphatase NudC (nudix superfamily)
MLMVALFVLVLLCSGDSILLLRRHGATFGDGQYSLVGGKVEAGETALQAIKREVQEEVSRLTHRARCI